MRWRRRTAGDVDLFAFLESCLEGDSPTGRLTHQSAAVSRTLELANDDWCEAEAARELLRLVAGDRRVLVRLQEVFEGRMLQSLLPELRCLRAQRIVDLALVQSYASG